MIIDDHIDVSVFECDDGYYAVLWERGSYAREFSFKSRTAAATACRKIAERARCGGAPSLTVSEFAPVWLRDYVKAERSAKTLSVYESDFRQLVAPRLGNVNLDLITRAQADTFVDGLLRDRGLASAISGKRTLSAMLGIAEKWGYIDSNPCTDH